MHGLPLSQGYALMNHREEQESHDTDEVSSVS